MWIPEIAYRVRRAKGLRPNLRGDLLMTAWKRIEGRETRESKTKSCVVEVKEDCQENDK